MIYAGDAKAVNIDNIFINLFMLLKHNGVRPRQNAGSKTFIDFDTFGKVFERLQDEGSVNGFKENPNALKLWLRSNLVNMVSRGNLEKEKISSLRPIHLESYRVRNARHNRDYNTADQVYLMLGSDPQVKEELKTFLMEGWDNSVGKLEIVNGLDVDSLGLLHIIKNIKPGFLDTNSSLNKIKPLLEGQAKLFCDDVRRILVYKNNIPRSVIIEYLKTITSFHLSIYVQKLVYALPKMVEAGTTDVKGDWNIVVDLSDDLDSKISGIATEDALSVINNISDYIKATFQINAALRSLHLDKTNSNHLNEALAVLWEKNSEFEIAFKTKWGDIIYNADEDDRLIIEDVVKFETSYFDKYIELIVKERGNYQYRYNTQLIDNLSQKNNERGFMAQGRSKKHPRRFVLGTRLLETIVQILVLDSNEEGFTTTTLSIESLIDRIRKRYGLIINGLDEKRFENADLNWSFITFALVMGSVINLPSCFNDEIP